MRILRLVVSNSIASDSLVVEALDQRFPTGGSLIPGGPISGVRIAIFKGESLYVLRSTFFKITDL